MIPFKFRKSDVEESFVHASGPGGQNVNKVATCVFLIHTPTGLQVKCQKYRTQARNREEAYRLLEQKFLELKRREQLRKVNEREKKRRQNRQRPKKLKESILEAKHKRSEVKSRRKKVDLRGKDLD